MGAESGPMTFRTLDDAANLAADDVNPYYLKDLKRRVAVARIGGRLYAFDDRYNGHSLSAGLLDGTVIMSQCDGSQFDIASGAVLRGPASEPLVTYEVRERDGRIDVRI